jgi:hypothetical protein
VPFRDGFCRLLPPSTSLQYLYKQTVRRSTGRPLLGLLSFPPRTHFIQNQYVPSAPGVRRPPGMKRGPKKFLHHHLTNPSPSPLFLSPSSRKPETQPTISGHCGTLSSYPRAIHASFEILSDVAYVFRWPQQTTALPLLPECFPFAPPRVPGWTEEQALLHALD